MKRKAVFLVAAATALIVPFGSAFAHHGAAGYEMDKVVTMKGTITKFEWGNPHSQIYFDVTDDKGNVAHWDAETEPPPVMLERGWTRKSLNPGDEVTVYCYVAKNGATTAILQKIVLANGKELTARGGSGGQ
jgi:hypothetical protein